MNRAISRISWYVDPNNAAGPGTYVALDFVGATENSPVYCGYVVLRPAADQGFEVVRVEQNFIDRGSYESMADREPDDPLPVLNCHFGPYRMLIPAS